MNNSHFEIYKSTDGQNYEMIGRKEGFGNSNSVRQYNFIDPRVEPLQYYKFKQVDFDGGFEYSHVIAVSGTDEKLDFVQQTKEELIITPKKNTRIIITNQSGQLMMDEVIVSKKTINKSEFSSGTYIIQVSNQEGVQTLKWINVPH
jgi:hypothetical protein